MLLFLKIKQLRNWLHTFAIQNTTEGINGKK